LPAGRDYPGLTVTLKGFQTEFKLGEFVANPNLKSVESCAINNSETVDMKVCWHMFARRYRESLFVIAGVPRREYLPYLHSPWEYMPFECRARVMAVLNSWENVKDFNLNAARERSS
jgi:hypothetical protein